MKNLSYPLLAAKLLGIFFILGGFAKIFLGDSSLFNLLTLLFFLIAGYALFKNLRLGIYLLGVLWLADLALFIWGISLKTIATFLLLIDLGLYGLLIIWFWKNKTQFKNRLY